MDFVDIITRKKFNQPLSDAEVAYFANAAADPASKDYQLAALLMAIRLNGMDARETAALAVAMAHTGDVLTPDVGGIAVDKHSTGGVADTTTLILVPLAAACGAKVVKMSGRGLGHTGGTIDKMESIPGMQVELPEQEFLDIVRRVGCCVVSQSDKLAPADKRLYALRDVTSTVDSIPLIASSIMSKKIASGAQGIVLDVKTGTGAIMHTLEECMELARTMVDIGTRAGRSVQALITGMQEPLGSHVGNALEVKEAIDVLAGRTQGPLLEVSLLLGARMLMTGGLAADEEDARNQLLDALRTGRGLQKLAEMIAAQGGDPRVCEDVTLLPQASIQLPVPVAKGAYLQGMDAQAIGLAAQHLGAGRLSKEDVIDPAVGLVMHHRIGDYVAAGEAVATIHANDARKAEEAARKVMDALIWGDHSVPPAKLLYASIDDQHTEVFA